jgi:hypothetical protein
MSQRRLRVVVDKAAGGHQMPGDALGVARIEPLQRVPDGAVEIPRVDPLG